MEWGPGTSLGTFLTVEDVRGRRNFYLVIDVQPYLASGGSSGGPTVSRTTTPGAFDNALVVRTISSGTQTIAGTIVDNQGTGWRDPAGVPIGQPITVGGFDVATGFPAAFPIDNVNVAVPITISPASSLGVFGNGNPAFPVLISNHSRYISGANRPFNPTASHITTNATTTLTAADAWVSSVVITVDVAGTTSTITIQDKSATPKKLVNALVTTALSTTPTVLALADPVLMSAGIDIVTAGAVAATEDVWVSYWQ